MNKKIIFSLIFVFACISLASAQKTLLVISTNEEYNIGEDLLRIGTFESKSLDGFYTNPDTVDLLRKARKKGKAGIIMKGDDSFIACNATKIFRTQKKYLISAWVYVLQEGGSWGNPYLRLSHNQDLMEKSDLGHKHAEDRVSDGWQFVYFIKEFTKEELSSDIYVGVRYLGFTGICYIDDISIAQIYE